MRVKFLRIGLVVLLQKMKTDLIFDNYSQSNLSRNYPIFCSIFPIIDLSNGAKPELFHQNIHLIDIYQF